MSPPIPCLEEELVTKVNDGEQRQENVRVHKITGIERRQCGPSLNKRQKDVGSQTEVGVVGVQEGLEREFARAMTLNLPSRPETDVGERDGAPDKEGRDTGEVDDVAVGLTGTGADVHHAESATGVGKDNGRNGHAATISPSQELGGFAVLGHVEEGPAADVDGAVYGTEAGDEDEGVDEMHAACPPGVLNGNGHGTLEGPAPSANEAFCIGRTGQSEEEGASHVDEQDAPEYLTDRAGNGYAGVLGLGSSNGDGFHPGVKGTAEHKDGGNAAEPIHERPRVVPIVEAEGWVALDPSCDVAKRSLVAASWS